MAHFLEDEAPNEKLSEIKPPLTAYCPKYIYCDFKNEKKSIRVLCSHCEKILVPIEEEIAIEEPASKATPPSFKLELVIRLKLKL